MVLCLKVGRQNTDGSSVNKGGNRAVLPVNDGHDFSDGAAVSEPLRICGLSLDPETIDVFIHEYSADTKKKRSRLRLSDDTKVDYVYTSLHGMNDVKLLPRLHYQKCKPIKQI